MDIQEKDMCRENTGSLRTRRVGSVTFGLTLVLFGILFLIHTVIPSLDYEIIFQCWPMVFVLLGVEILVENRRSNAEKCDSDAGYIAFVCYGDGGGGSFHAVLPERMVVVE